jgi:hypothetical protein
MTYQRPSITPTNALPTTANGLASPPPIPPMALEAPRWKTGPQRREGGSRQAKWPIFFGRMARYFSAASRVRIASSIEIT